ncbi:MAG: PqqD family protein [Patescibacteria group bacterium]
MGKTFVAYDNETGVLHEFNEIGFAIVSEIAKGEREKDIARKLTKIYRVRPERALADVEEFLKTLEKKNLITPRK